MKGPVSMRIWFAFISAMLWVGIYFTGFSTVNWLLYLPATGLALAGIIGICQSQIADFFKLSGQNKKTLSNRVN